MKTLRYITLLLLLLPVLPAVAQKGTGDPVGIVRQGIRPEVITLSGTLKEVQTQPCENTTGRSPLGTHLIVRTRDQGDVNVHLGMAAAVTTLAGSLKPGDRLEIQAFRTDQLARGAYIAKEVTAGGKTTVLRDDLLRPTWAGQAAGTGRGAGGGRSVGAGRAGGGRGMGAGRAAGGGRGMGPCRQAANV